MMGYLQRLLDAALPASGPGPLTPVVKSTSPIFEQNQLLGLADLHAGEGDAEVAPPVADVRSAQTPFPPAAPAATLEITGRNPQPVTPALWPEATLGRPMSVAPLPPRPVAATAPALPELPDAVIGPAQPDPETLEPAPRLEAEPLAPRQPAWEVTPAPAPLEPVLPLAETGRVATEAAPPILPEARSQVETEARPATLHTVVRDVPRDLEAIERAADAPLPPRDVEPR
ncbi:MAG: hypothetical protein ACREJ5_25445, partial [Geminicoccaceae bacterium]